MFLKIMPKEENYVNVVDKTTSANKTDRTYQCFCVQLQYHDVKRQNLRNQFVVIQLMVVL